ncbi:MAG: hypothetical protein ABI681_12905, partial [Gemmatimonadales bacterium]
CSLDDYLAKHRTQLAASPSFPYSRSLSREQRATMAQAVSSLDGYITGGHSAELRGEGAPARTPLAAARAGRASSRR